MLLDKSCLAHSSSTLPVTPSGLAAVLAAFHLGASKDTINFLSQRGISVSSFKIASLVIG